ncbi:MAG: iron-containing alcohol dehydrogenase, partial [Candidatus Accumulibacter sp.]|nr:iron-containing alcohol dehydrogenase [Accumulibacter sp.]
MSAPIAAFDFILPTRVVFGVGAVKRLADEIEALGVRRPLLVTDKGLVACGVVEKVAGFLGRFEPRVFDGVEANPKDRNVAEGAAAYLEHAADGVLAVGGGSPIDCAKSIAVLVANGRRKIKEFEGRDKPSKPLPPLVCVPTTAGTGS